MAVLSQQVVLIPVIAKADTMTVEETAKYRAEVLERCLNPNGFITRTSSSMPELKMNFFT
jgi:septin family protein